MDNTPIVPKKRTLGDFKKYASRKFPLDCDGLNDMQLNEALLSILGKLGGSQYILSGCVKTNGTWSEGYIFTATTLFPEGELLYVESGTQDTILVQTDSESITASGSTYDGAYTKRYCKHGVGTEQFDLSSFVRVQTNKQLHDRITQLENTVITPEAVGSVKMWPSTVVPPGWALCDGTLYDKVQFATLYAVVGNQFGTSGNSFRVPDMRSRFPVAWNEFDGDFDTVGKKDGSKEHLLTLAEMPVHNHSYVAMRASYKAWGSTSAQYLGVDSDMRTGNEGGGQPFKHLPPYFVIPFIIKIQ